MNAGDYGPQIICYATFDVRFTNPGGTGDNNLCLNVKSVDDQVAIYWHRTDRDSSDFDKSEHPEIPVGFPEYFSSSDCDCHGETFSGCACRTDYPYLMNFGHKKINLDMFGQRQLAWGNRFSYGYWGDTKYRIGNWKKGQSGEKCENSMWPGSTYRVTIWYFNEDRGRASQTLDISANDISAGWRVYPSTSLPCCAEGKTLRGTYCGGHPIG
jgi:hypothetical protein